MTIENDTDNCIVAIHFESNIFGAAILLNGEVKVLHEDYSGIHRDLFDMISLHKSQIKFISSSRSNVNGLKLALPHGTSLQLIPSINFALCTADELQNEFSITINHECVPSNESCFKSLRALLTQLSDEKIPKQVSFLHIESTNVIISKSCLQALQIFDYEPHPNMHASNQGFKEGCSIYSLFNQTASEEGRAKLKKWFQQPTNNIQILKYRQESIEILMESEMISFTKSIIKSLKKCIRISVQNRSKLILILNYLECCK